MATTTQLRRLEKQIAALHEEVQRLLQDETEPAPARRRQRRAKAADDGLPFAGYEQVKPTDKPASRRLLAEQDLKTLEKALAYERSKGNRAQVVEMIEQVIRYKKGDVPSRGRRPKGLEHLVAEAAAPARKEKPRAARATGKRGPGRPPRQYEPGMPFRGFEKIASSKLTESRRELRRRSLEELEASLEYERTHEKRKAILQLIESELQRKREAVSAGAVTGRQQAQAAEPRRRGRRLKAEQVDPEKLPFPEYLTVASSRRTASMHLLAEQDLETLKKARQFERRHDNRKQVLAMIEEMINRKSGKIGSGRGRQPVLGVPEEQPPFRDYTKVRSSDQSTSRAVLSKQDVATLRKALDYERKHRNRRQVIRLIEQVIARKENGGAPQGRSRKSSAKAESASSDSAASLPFPEYRQVASSRQAESRRILQQQDLDTLQQALAYEREHKNRRQVIALLERVIAVKQAGGSARRGRPAKGQATTHPAGEASTAPQRKPGRPPRQYEPGMPFRGFEKIASSKLTESRRELRRRSLEELEASLEYERTHEKRKAILQLIESELVRRRGSASGQLGLQGAASQSQETQAQGTQPRPSPASLPEPEVAAPAPAQAPVEDAQAGQPQAADGKAQVEQEQLPFAGFDQLSPIRLEDARALLIGQDVDTLKRARAWEETHGRRREILQLIDAVIEQKRARRQPPSPAPAKEPVDGYDSLPTNLVLSVIADGAWDHMLAQVLAWEQAHQNRKEVVEALQERMASDQGPRLSPTGREWQGSEPFRGYATLDHSDPEALRAAFRQRSAPELRRVEQAELRQDFPSQEAIRIAREVLEEKANSSVIA